MKFRGFWSYVHEDDEAEGGRIAQLARDLVAQYELLTGDEISLFLDRDAIEWGDFWRDEINRSLENIAFFIPVLTPRYLKSPECRSEAMTFARRTSEMNLASLWLPIHYVNVPGLSADNTPDDEILQISRERHWVDWRGLRLHDVMSSDYRTAVAGLADRIAEANRSAEADATSEALETPSDDGGPGVLDVMAESDDVLTAWTETMNSMTTITGSINEKLRQAGVKANASVDVAYKRSVFRTLAQEIRGDVDDFGGLAGHFVSGLHDIDGTVVAMFNWLDVLPEETDNAERAEAVNALALNIAQLAETLENNFRTLNEVDSNLGILENISRDIRPVIRQWRQSLVKMTEAKSITQRWRRAFKKESRCPGIETNLNEVSSPLQG